MGYTNLLQDFMQSEHLLGIDLPGQSIWKDISASFTCSKAWQLIYRLKAVEDNPLAAKLATRATVSVVDSTCLQPALSGRAS